MNRRNFVPTVVILCLAFSTVCLALANAQDTHAGADARATIVSLLRQLGACRAELGAANATQADVVDGIYVNWTTVKQQIEVVNPQWVFDLETHKLIPAPAAGTPSPPK